MPAQQPGARILGAVDAVAEAHDPLAAVEQVVRRSASASPACRRRVEHRQHARGRAAVERAGERADRRRERRGAVGARRRDDPRGEGRGVEAVLGGADPVGVERLHVPAGRPRRATRAGTARRVDSPCATVCGAIRSVSPSAIRADCADDRDELRREPREILARLLVGDVDQLLEIPLRRRARAVTAWRSAGVLPVRPPPS